MKHSLRQPTKDPLDLYKAIKDRDARFQLIVDWFNLKRNRATDIIQIYNRLSRDFGLSSGDLRSFLKIAKQRILRLEIKQGSVRHTGEDPKTIYNFLDTHRGRWTSCFSVSFRVVRLKYMP